MSPLTLVRLDAAPLAVPLLEPFVIASARVAVTPSVLLRAVLEDPATGRRRAGLGEAASLPGVTHEGPDDVLAFVRACAASLRGSPCTTDTLPALLDGAFAGSSVTRGGVEAALLDAMAKHQGLPLYRLLDLSRASAPTLRTDITVPILGADLMATRAREWNARGFSTFKVKVGISLTDDLRALRAMHEAVPGATFRIDANGGYRADEALALLDECARVGLHIECFEQPCARDDLDGMAQVTARDATPVIADESVRDLADLDRVLTRRAAHGINIKLVKTGGPLRALALARAARAHGMKLMVGAMVETRLGITTMAHAVTAMGGADYIDLDTAFLLAEDPFIGGYRAAGDRLDLDPFAACALRANFSPWTDDVSDR